MGVIRISKSCGREKVKIPARTLSFLEARTCGRAFYTKKPHYVFVKHIISPGNSVVTETQENLIT